MNARDDGPFARWSRRKLAAPSSGNRKHGQGEPPPADPVNDAPASAPSPEVFGPVETDGDEAVEPLPLLEDLTAESDLSAFLRKGIPAALKSAAMRRMWSLDPAIRDYVGPAEYAWDFNQPDSMRGFGALDSNKAVVDFLSKTARATVSEEDKGTSTEAAGLSSQVEVSEDTEANGRPGSAADAGHPVEPDVSVQQPAPPRDGTEVADARADAEPVETPPVQSRHGGAMPR